MPAKRALPKSVATVLDAFDSLGDSFKGAITVDAEARRVVAQAGTGADQMRQPLVRLEAADRQDPPRAVVRGARAEGVAPRIHPAADDLNGRDIGHLTGLASWAKARQLFGIPEPASATPDRKLQAQS